MRYSHAENPPQISDDVFRVLSLRLEVQNDVEVVKPVLEELEVMRLSCALGALATVNLQDFRHDMLEAREFDDDFARFLRADVFTPGRRHHVRSARREQARGDSDGNAAMEVSDDDDDEDDNKGNSSTADGVRVMSLFGQQSEVKRELVRLGCWSSACEARLRSQDQGIYCARMSPVHCATDDDNTDAAADDKVEHHSAGHSIAMGRKNKDKDERVLVLFAWLQDHLFQSARLRDTATYILRFLTCLSPHVVCCLSAADVAVVRKIVAGLTTSQPQAFKSYSVAFRVERQETEKDEVRCEHVRDIDLSTVVSSEFQRSSQVSAVPRLSDSASPSPLSPTAAGTDVNADKASPRLIKGSYPAIVAVTLAPVTTRIQRQRVEVADPEKLAQWLAARTQTARLQVNYGSWIVDHSFHTRFLAALRALPDHAFAQIEYIFARSTVDAEARTREDVDTLVEEQRALLLRHTDSLFSVELLLNSVEVRSASVALHKCLNKLRNDWNVWSCLDTATQVALTLPVRLRSHMKNFHALFAESMDAELRGALERIEHTTRPTDIFVDGSTAESSGSLLATIRGWLRSARGNSSSGTAAKKGASDISPEFRVCMAPALDRMKLVWWEAVEKALEATNATLPAKWAAQTVAALRQMCDEDRRKAVATAFVDLHHAWEHDAAHELSVRVDVRKRLQTLLCDVHKDVWEPPTPQLEVWKIDMDDTVTATASSSDRDIYANASNSSGSGVRSLGVVPLRKSAAVLDVFSIQTRAVLVVTTSSDGVSVERIRFAAWQPSFGNFAPKANVKLVRHFGRQATRCDLLLSARLMAFVSASDEVVLYKFSDAFTSMEVVRTINVGVCASLAPPLADLLLLESDVFMRDAAHAAQSVNHLNQQTSRKSMRALVHHDSDCNRGHEDDGDAADGADVWSSRVFALADGLVVACLSVKDGGIGAAFGELAAISSEDHRKLPVTFVGASSMQLASTRGVSVQVFGNALLVTDPLANRVRVYDVRVTVRSDSFRIRHSGSAANSSARGQLERSDTGINATTRRTEHWLWAFYHLFEKFPVAGLLCRGSGDMTHHLQRQSQLQPLQVKVVCPSASASADAAFADYRAYFGSVMDQLRKLNKPLGDMNLPRDLVVVAYTGSGTKRLGNELARLGARPLAALLQEMVTFVPIQICRAESNMLTVMTDGQDTSSHESESEGLEVSSRQLQTVDIARSIRFGLLSPLLESWRGRCIVVTSMGKQSTGKSYFLNHLTGSSFAIAGARCTDGAWMTLRVLPNDVILVVLDFEGLGSFERTEQEDVFLSVLNAAMSMFTVFRIESRLDKDIDELFCKFQRGIALLKHDPRLFRGLLYMGVKDVNPNDQSGIVDEFVRKFEALVSANKEHNFLCEMYQGRLEINCSPPLGTNGYYESLAHAQQYIEHNLCGGGNDDGDSASSMGFANGRAFLDCLRLVLAKISILDWTALDESSQSLQLAEVRAKLPGVVRTGCLVPTDHVGDTSEVPQHLKEDLSLGNREVDLRVLCVAYPELANKWHELDRTLALDSILDRDIDLALDVSALGDDAASMRAMALPELLHAPSHSTSTPTAPAHQQHQHKLSVIHQSAFDLFLLFVTRRRKLRILAWARARLGDRLPDDWQALEAQHLGRFQMLFTRCARVCGSCQLGCMLPAAHSTVASEHDCGTNHRCQGRCEYCNELSHDISSINGSDCGVGGKTPLCAKPAGHEGKCECADGDHTCGKECCLVRAANCGLRCVELVGHAGSHRCSVEIHHCGMACSARHCTGVCTRNIATPHSAHKCEHTACMEQCSMDGCNRVCGFSDHFHGQTELALAFSVESVSSIPLPSESEGATTDTMGKSGVGGGASERVFDAESQTPTIHMCASAHECQAMCAEQGNCCVQVFHKQSSRMFDGARGAFKYTFQEMNGFRKKCAVVLAPGHQTHAGAHSCVVTTHIVGVAVASGDSSSSSDAAVRIAGSSSSESDAHDGSDSDSDVESDDTLCVLHYCEARCPCCSYFCRKPVGHLGMHATSHGNMRNTYFLADTGDVDVAERKYRAGESGSAEMCSLYCSKMGRAHVHYLECAQKSATTCVYAGDSSDMRRHCTRVLEPTPPHAVDELLHEQFWKTLGWEDPCTSPDERAAFGKCAFACDAPEHRKKPSFCVLPAWHKPEVTTARSAPHDGFAYVGGHKFECSHVANSGKLHHVFVLDCSGSMSGTPWMQLLAAYREYLHNRVSNGAPFDLVSVVTFDSYAKIEYEAQNITTMLRASDSLTYRGGGTTYSAGLRAANEVLSRNTFEAYKPVLVFFSDGQPCDPAQGEKLATHIRSSYGKYGLEAFAVGYGIVNMKVLQRVAELLGGSYHEVLLGTELKRAFHTISASLGTRAGLALAKPLHESNCPICQRDMAAEVNVTLRPCGHTLHRACKKELVKCNGGSGGGCSDSSVACPICRKPIIV